MKTPLEVLHKYFHHFNSERTRDLVVKAMEDYANIYHDSEVKKLNIPAVIHWVAISEKMPESGFCILLYSKSGGVAEGAWIGAKGHFEQWRWNSIVDDVTHWAELPESPCV